MKRVIVIIFAGAALIWAGNFYWQNVRVAGPTVQPPAPGHRRSSEEDKTPRPGNPPTPAAFP